MSGFQEHIKSNLSLDDVGAILQSKLGHLVEIEPLLNHEKTRMTGNLILLLNFFETDGRYG